jgi:hypothetical protein
MVLGELQARPICYFGRIIIKRKNRCVQPVASVSRLYAHSSGIVSSGHRTGRGKAQFQDTVLAKGQNYKQIIIMPDIIYHVNKNHNQAVSATGVGRNPRNARNN